MQTNMDQVRHCFEPCTWLCTWLSAAHPLLQGRQTMPIKMDEGTLLAVLNAAATQADGQLARDTWALLVRTSVSCV